MEFPAAHKLQLPVLGHHQSQGMVLLNPKNQQQQQQAQAQGQEKKARPQPEQALKCPRCTSTNTKFCYYNNYSLSQPRYFCKSCRRYWTQGGSLRNVPVGGGCRKNKRSSSSASAAASSTKINKPSSDLDNNVSSTANLLANSFPPLPSIPHLSDDLTLAFAAGLHRQPVHDHNNGFLLGHNAVMNNNIIPSANPSFLDILRSTTTTAYSSVNDHNLNSIPNAEDLMSNLYYGSEEPGFLSFDGDLQPRRVQGGHEGPCSKDMEEEGGGGDQTKGAMGLNSWHGHVMNGSSFMGAARMDMSTSTLGDAYTFF